MTLPPHLIQEKVRMEAKKKEKDVARKLVEILVGNILSP